MPRPRHSDWLAYIRGAFERMDVEAQGCVTRERVLQELPWLQQVLPEVARHLKVQPELGITAAESGKQARTPTAAAPLDSKGMSIWTAGFTHPTIDWATFRDMCLWLRKRQDLENASVIEVFDVVVERSLPRQDAAHASRAALLLRSSRGGARLKCELTGPCQSIHHQAHRIEWRITNWSKPPGQEFQPGQHMGSRMVEAAGVSGLSLRFWPAGYLSAIQKRQKYMYTFKLVSGWCCVGLFAPKGTALRVQFFIQDRRSEVTDIYFDGPALHRAQLWEPPVLELPPGDEAMLVGVDIFENLREKRRHTASEPRMANSTRLTRALSDLAPQAWMARPAVGGPHGAHGACSAAQATARVHMPEADMHLAGKSWTDAKRRYPLSTNVVRPVARSRSTPVLHHDSSDDSDDGR